MQIERGHGLGAQPLGETHRLLAGVECVGRLREPAHKAEEVPLGRIPQGLAHRREVAPGVLRAVEHALLDGADERPCGGVRASDATLGEQALALKHVGRKRRQLGLNPATRLHVVHVVSEGVDTKLPKAHRLRSARREVGDSGCRHTSGLRSRREQTEPVLPAYAARLWVNRPPRFAVAVVR